MRQMSEGIYVFSLLAKDAVIAYLHLEPPETLKATNQTALACVFSFRRGWVGPGNFWVPWEVEIEGEWFIRCLVCHMYTPAQTEN